MPSNEVEFATAVITRLLSAGWSQDDILSEPTLVVDGRQLRPDIVLSIASYPLAVVEIKQTLRDLPGAIRQISSYLEPLSLRHGIIVGTGEIATYDALTGVTDATAEFPSPRVLWEALGREWTELDPRLGRFPNRARPIGIYQQMALGRALDAICAGKKQILLVLPQQSGSSRVLLDLTSKLLVSQTIQRALVVTGQRVITEQLRHIFEPIQTHYSTSTDPTSNDRVVFTTTRALLNDQHAKLRKIPTDYFDLLLLDGTALNEDLVPITQHFSNAIVVGRSTNRTSSLVAAQYFGAPEFEHSFQDAIDAETMTIPAGFRSVKLGSIADMSAGITGLEKQGLIEAEAGNPVVFASDISDEGRISLHRRLASPLIASGQLNHFLLQENDILISRMFSTTKIRVAITGRDLHDKGFFASPLLRIRVRQEEGTPRDVYDFLCSEMGQRYLRGFSHGSSIQVLSTAALDELPILLPIADAQETPSPTSFSKPAMALQELEQYIIPALQDLKQQSSLDDQALEQIARRLQNAATILVPPPLHERILSLYPTPIALAFARYREAQFNVFEQVLRLRDLFETISFFLFNVTLADAFHRLNPVSYFIAEKGVRRAYNGFSTTHKMDFIQAIINSANSANRSPEELFLPQLARSSLVNSAKMLQDEFRNRISHTATATESQQQRLLDRFAPIVYAMLGELEFLVDYHMLRVRSFHWKKSKLVRTTELFQGVTPRLSKKPLDDESMLRVDQDHIALFNPQSGAVLDLHPLYQLIANEETRFETHLCFFKQRKKQVLEGESVNGAFGVTLDGGDNFDALQRRILDTLPTQ